MKLRKCSLFAAVVGALIFTAAFAPRANAALVVYYNFEEQPPAPDLTSEAIGMQTPPLVVTGFNGTFTDETGLPDNVFPTDPDTNLHSLGLKGSSTSNGAMFCFTVNTQPLVGLSLSFAVNTMGNGYLSVDLSYIINGVTTDVGAKPILTAMSSQTISWSAAEIGSGAEGSAAVTFCLTFSGANPNEGNNLQNQIDNIQLNAAQVIPEPASVVGGLLGACAICWYQRRRLIGFLRLRPA
jgi:hypothetical protein